MSYGCLWFSLLVDILATAELHSVGFSLYRVGGVHLYGAGDSVSRSVIRLCDNSGW